MTRWARLTWQARDPSALAGDLERRLGVARLRRRPGSVPGTWFLPLGSADLEIVPWRPESPSDAPTSSGRLVFEPIEGGADDPDPTHPVAFRLVGVGWATVELDRAERELDSWVEPVAPGTRDDREPHLGARTRVRATAGLPGDHLVLAEPATEGSLAASLARDGEGPCALYLWPSEGLDGWLAAARLRDMVVPKAAAGPFGRSVLLPGSAVAGPHVIVVEAPVPSSSVDSPGTIAP